MPSLLSPLLFLMLVRGGSAQDPLQLFNVCHPPGSASVWVDAKSGSLVACDNAIETNGSKAIYVPDLGAPVIVVMPPSTGMSFDPSTSSPDCLLLTDVGSKVLVPQILISYTASGMLYALLCPLPHLSDPSFPGFSGGSPPWAKLFSKLDSALPFFPADGLPIWFFGLLAAPSPSVTSAAGGAFITLTGFNFAISVAVGSRGEGGGGGTAAASAALIGDSVGMTCRFTLSPGNYSTPWHVLLATPAGVEPLGRTGLQTPAVAVTQTTTICQLPPMPQGFIPGQDSVLVSLSPDPFTISFSAPRMFSLFTPVATSTSVARASKEGGFEIVVEGIGFPPVGLASEPALVSFGSTIVPATYTLYGQVVCTVPAHSPGLIPLSLSFDGQTFIRGDVSFLFYDTVAITSVSPMSAPHTGKSSVTCSGTNFQPLTPNHGVKCRFQRGASSYMAVGSMVADGGVLRAVCPTPALTNMTSQVEAYTLAVSFNAEANLAPQWSQSANIDIFMSPIVTKTVPRMISAGGGSRITLVGNNFEDTSSAACRFASGFSSKVKFTSSTQIECLVPATPSKLPRLTVCVTLNGMDCSDYFEITIYAVQSVFPRALPQKGGFLNASLNAVHVLGEVGVNGANVVCEGKACIRCRFLAAEDGWIVYGAVSSVVASFIVCTVPELKQGIWQLDLSLNGGPFGDWDSSHSLQIYPEPAVSSIVPCAGPVSGGTLVTLRGSNFYKPGDVSALCSFGGISTPALLTDCTAIKLPCKSALCVSADANVQVLCKVAVCASPDANASGTPSANSTTGMVRYTQPDTVAGQGAYNTSFAMMLNSVSPSHVGTFIFYNVPVIESVTPSACTNTGMSTVTIIGRDLSGGYNRSRFCKFMPADPSNHEMLFLDPRRTAGENTAPELMVTQADYTQRGTQLVCPCPNNPRLLQQPLRLVVSLNGQQYHEAGIDAAVHAPVKLYATTPLSGDVQGSSIVYATGANFMQGPGLKMIFGTESVPATVIREGVIRAYSPPSVNLVLGKISIWVSNNGGIDRSAFSTTFEYFSSGLGCPVEKDSQKTCYWNGLEYGNCANNECTCKTGYWGRACSLVPATAAIFPRSGVPSGGTKVSVRGLFLGGECCSLAAEHAAMPFTVTPQPNSMLKVRTGNIIMSATYETFNDALQFVAPDYPAGSVISLEVSFDGGARYIAAPDSFRYEQGPAVSSFNPTTSPLGGDTIVTIRGERFWDNVGLSCKFGNAGQTRALWISTSIIMCATSPYISRPARPSTDIDIDGNADVMLCTSYNSATCVKNGNVLCIWNQSTCIPAYAESTTTTGSQILSVSTNGQDFTTLPMAIHYYNESSVYHVNPTFGAVTGGTIVTVMGPPDFIPSPEGRCRFGTDIVAATVSANWVKCLSPSTQFAGRVTFSVALDGQHFVCVPSASNGDCSYIFFERVVVWRLFPSIGSTFGGLRITVTGLAFLPFPTARCRFGDVSVVFSVSDGTSGVCITPRIATAGNVPFAVTINGIDEENLAAGFQYYLVPQLSSLIPNGASLDGGATVTISGRNFELFADHYVLCRFKLMTVDNDAMTLQSPGSNSTSTSVIAMVHPQAITFTSSRVVGEYLVCIAPKSNISGTYSLQVSLIGTRTSAGLVEVGEEWSMGLAFDFYSLPIMLGLKPALGGMLGATEVLAILSRTVNLAPFARCIFQVQGGKSIYVEGSVFSQSSVRCATPGMNLVGDMYPTVRVALNGQDLTDTMSFVFTYVNQANSSVVSPTETTTNGGTLLRITGTNFAKSIWASCVFREFGSSARVAVPATAVSSATVVSSTQARCYSPAITTPGSYQVTVAPSDTFEGFPVPLLVIRGGHVNSLLPSHGLLTGRTTVTLVGTNFVKGKTPICLFGLRMVQGRHVDEQNIVCISPPSPLDRLFRVQVTLSLDGGITYLNSTKTYEYYPLVAVLDYYPELGVIGGGTMVRVSATSVRNVSGVTCRFGLDKVSAIIQSNPASGRALLTCLSPPHVEGLVQFALSLNGQDEEFAVAGSLYTFHRPLVATGMWPTAGPFAGGTLVTLTADQGSRTIYSMDLDLVSRPRLLPPDPMPASRWVYCKIGNELVTGRQIAEGIECRVTPCSAVNASGGSIRDIHMSINGHEFVSSRVYRFFCAEVPIVDRVLPSMGPSQVGSTITLYGRNLTGTSRSRCSVGNLSSPATVVTTSMAYCTALPIIAKNISRQARDFLGDDSSLGSSQGGGSSGDATIPGALLGTNRVTLSVDGQHYETHLQPQNTNATFYYYPSVSVEKIEPASGRSSQGPINITVFGRGFMPHKDAYAECRFGSVVVNASVKTSEVLECTAPAVSAGTAVLVELAFNRRDFEKHNSVFFLRLSGAPEIEAVTFASALNALHIRWLKSTDRGAFRSASGSSLCGVASQHLCGVVYERRLIGWFACSQLLTAPSVAALGTLGSGARCRWQDNLTLVVSMGANSTVMPGANLSLLPNSVMQGSEVSFYTDAELPPVKLPSPAEIPWPVPVIVAPKAVGPCDDIVLDASMSYNTGGRPLNFSWTLVSPITTLPSLNMNISSLMQASSGPERDSSRTLCQTVVCNKLVIPTALLTPQDYTIQLTVTSWFGRMASSRVTVTKIESSELSELPSLRILAPLSTTTTCVTSGGGTCIGGEDCVCSQAASEVQIRQGDTVTIKAVVDPSACTYTTQLSSTPTIALKWSVREKLTGGGMGNDVLALRGIHTTSATLRLAPHVLSAKKAYWIEVSASLLSGASATAGIPLTVTPSDLLAWISGGDRVVSDDQDLFLDASRSYDPDAHPLSSPLPLTFAWHCEIYDPDTDSSSTCSSVHSNFKFADAGKAVTYIALGKVDFELSSCAGNANLSQSMCYQANMRKLRARQYRISVTVSRADGSGLATSPHIRLLLAHDSTRPIVNMTNGPCGSGTPRERCKHNVRQALTLQGSVFLLGPTLSSSSTATTPALLPTYWTTWGWEGDVDESAVEVLTSSRDVLTPSQASSTLQSILLLKPHALTQGAIYIFRFSAACGSGIGEAVSECAQGAFAQVEVHCNEAPSGGSLLIDSTNGSALTSTFSLMAPGWSDEPNDMPISYSFFACLNTNASTLTSISMDSWTFCEVASRVGLVTTSLMPQHFVTLPMGVAPQYVIEIFLDVQDALGAAHEYRGACHIENPAAQVCLVTVLPPASTPLAVLDIVRGVGMSKLQSAVATQNFDAAISLVAVILSLLNSDTMGVSGGGIYGSSARRSETNGSLLTTLRALRDTIVASISGMLQSTTFLSPELTASVASTLKDIALVPAQVSAASIETLLSVANRVLASLDGASASPASQHLGQLLSSLRQALEYSRLVLKEVTATTALQTQDSLEASILAMTRKSVAGRIPGQDGVTMTFNTFVSYARVLPLLRPPASRGLARLKTEVATVYAHEESKVSVVLPDMSLPDEQVKLPPSSAGAAAASTTAAVDLIVTVWRANASFVRGGAMGIDEGSAAFDALLGQYVQVSLYWHGCDGNNASISTGPESRIFQSPIRIALRTLVPTRNINETTGRQSEVAACVYLGEKRRSWDIHGMSLALNSSSASEFVAISSGTGSGMKQVVCEAMHLTSFTVRAEETGCDLVPRSKLVRDRCRVCGGNDSCVDCSNVPFGNKARDACAICGGANDLASCLGCDGIIYAPGAARALDTCLICGGNGNHRGCDGKCHSAVALDECGICGGDGSACRVEGLFGAATRPLPVLCFPPVVFLLTILITYSKA